MVKWKKTGRRDAVGCSGTCRSTPYKPSGDSTLELTFEIPDWMTDDQVVEMLKEVSCAADDYHRSLGGHGLKVDAIHIQKKQMT